MNPYAGADIVDLQSRHDNDKEDHNPLLGTEYEESRPFKRSWLGSMTRNWSPIDSLEHSFNPSIEGLRGIAASLTMICHVMNSQYLFREACGTMGVTIFFALSGFLITAVLIRLRSTSHSAFSHIPRFYTDRFFRLGPALFLVVALIYPLYARNPVGIDMKYINRGALLTLSYLANITTFRYRPDSSGPWPNTWSLACEEQYYIFWAFALPFIVSRSSFVRFVVLATLVGISMSIRLYTTMYPGQVLWGTDWHVALSPNVWKMLVGSSLRLVPIPPWLLQRIWAYVGLLGLAFTLSLTLLPQPNYGFFAPGWNDHVRPVSNWTDVLSAIFTCLLLSGISGPRGGVGILESQPLRFLGRISYSWYLWQVPLIRLNYSSDEHSKLGDTGISFAIAICSTLYMEEPINRAYKRWKAKGRNSASSTAI